MSELSERRTQTENRIIQLRASLAKAASIAEGKACVYMTGSFGRREASRFSDLDLFILGKAESGAPAEGNPGRLLKRLDEICIKAELIAVTRQLGIPEFSKDGQYLVHYSIHELTDTLGTERDDVANTFTARLLLLLESLPLLGETVYVELIGEVIAAYWRDYEDHSTDFVPAFLANDILRLWRTFCVNYEARSEREPVEKKAKGKLTNYKLKHSRLLTCYSALLYLLAIYGTHRSVHPSDIIEMIRLSPAERLEWLRDQPHLSQAKPIISKLLAQYESFLSATNASEADLIERFSDAERARKYLEDSYEFGNTVFDALNAIGGGSRLHRLLAV